MAPAGTLGHFMAPTVSGEIPAEFIANVYSTTIPLPPDPGGNTIYCENKADIPQQCLHIPTTPLLTMRSRARNPGNGAEKKDERNKKAVTLAGGLTAIPPISTKASGEALLGAGPSWCRAGKEHVVDDRTDEERAPIVINLAQARGITTACLIAIGVFLSVINIPSRQVVNCMWNVWKIRGYLKLSELADKHFILEFLEEGDFEHVTGGGSWSYQKDVVLIQKLKENKDLNMVQFEKVPIWAQIAGIPFYLLSKQLTRDLGNKLGDFISIDNNARGDICDKILRARTRIPIGRALQRWITIGDELTEEVMVLPPASQFLIWP
ncbi:hypothetical protein ACQ4PT_033045 [Festuca glaucescens]